jgi:MSHA biogenesis protein MshQ
MNFNSVWLIVLTMLRAVPALLMLAGAAQAANLGFNGGAVASCTYASASQTYTCSTLALGANDSAVIASGYTVVVNNGVSFSSGQGLQMSGSARLQTSGSNALDLSGSQNLNVSGGSLAAGGNFKLGSNAQAITANVTAASVTTGGSSAKITGTVAATGLIDLGSSTTITGAVSGGSIKTNSDVILGPLTITGAIDLGSSNTINGAVSGASISTNSSVTMGPLSITGTVDLGSSNTINGSISANNIKTNSSLVVSGSVSVSGLADLGSGIKISGSVSAGSVKTNSPAQIGGAITAAGTVDLGSGVTVGGNVSGTTITTNSPVNITGNVSASTSFTLSSGSTVTGNITSPTVKLNASGVTVKGDIAASGSLDIGSGTTVTGNLTGGSLNLRASGVTVNGNVTFTGDVDMGSGDTINGDLSAHNVTTHSSGATINGNAAVNAIYLDWGASVSKTITCTGAAPGAPVCSCVTKADSSYQPTCGAPPVAGPHHIQISHSGSALTCQPQTVTLTACANANCTAPHYTAATAVTLQPGGKVFTVTGGVNSAATVEQGAQGTALLSSSSHAYSCVNSGDPAHPCEMKFTTSGLTVTAPNHVSMAGATVTIQALTASGNNQSCVPLVASKTVSIDMACTYSDPVSGTIQPKIGSTSLSCGGGTTGVQMSFNASGIASAVLEYADAGKVNLAAGYTYSGGGTAFSATGNNSFIAAPKEFLIVATNAVTGVSTAVTHDIFAKASEPFTVKVSAVNALGNVTRNFGREATPESVTFLPPTVVNPVDAGNSGTISQGQFNAFSNGVADSKSGSAGQWNFSDVGAIKLDARLTNASTYYMGYTPLTGFVTKGTLTIARFIPDHFDTVLMTDNEISTLAPTQTGGRTMNCSGLVAGVNPCTGTSTGFIHSGQPFFLKVLAYNGASPTPGLTSNYAGSLAKPITTTAWTAAGGAVAATGALTWSGADPKFSFTAGSGTPAAPGPSSTNLPRFTFTSAYPASDILPATIYLRAIDTDNVSSLRGVSANSVEAPLTVVSGRLLVANAYGSQNSPLPIDASAQYYMPSGYVFNSQVNAVSATTVASKITFSKCQKALDISGNGSLICPASLKVANPNDVLTLDKGKGTFRMAAPTPTLTGIGSANVSLGLIFDYLPSSTGRETFGIYRSGPVIYTREVHN